MANKKRRCAHCRNYFEPESGIIRGTQFFCCKEHLIEYATSNKDKLVKTGQKIERNNLRKRKEALRPRKWYLDEAQKWFNKFIRLRDKNECCISCGKPLKQFEGLRGQLVDAGHYRSRGSTPELRFEELNCHAQCVRCNRELSGNVTNYRINLLNKIGPEKLAWLEGPHEPKKYTIDDLKEIIAKHKAKCKELEND